MRHNCCIFVVLYSLSLSKLQREMSIQNRQICGISLCHNRIVDKNMTNLVVMYCAYFHLSLHSYGSLGQRGYVLVSGVGHSAKSMVMGTLLGSSTIP